MNWPHPYFAIENLTDAPALEAELQRELGPGHPLFGLPIRATGRRGDQDDAILEVLDGSGRVAEVHLTWAGKAEQPPWPFTRLFKNLNEWAQSIKQEGG